jgi:hypothetical protein
VRFGPATPTRASVPVMLMLEAPSQEVLRDENDSKLRKIR